MFRHEVTDEDVKVFCFQNPIVDQSCTKEEVKLRLKYEDYDFRGDLTHIIEKYHKHNGEGGHGN